MDPRSAISLSGCLMAVWRQTVVLCCVLNCLVSSAPSLVLKNKYNNSFHLTRSTRTRVQQLEKKYKEQQLGDRHFEDRSQQLEGLPLLSTDFYVWLKLSDWERLHAALWDIKNYWDMLDKKRKHLEEEGEEAQVVGAVVRNTLPQAIKHIQLDLQDLMPSVSVHSNTAKTVSLSSADERHSTNTGPKTVWSSRVEGYVILRDLDLYLTKLARDFLLLASKTHVTQQKEEKRAH
uniref:Ciliary neurotrophic factor n=1 Tax=Takifugu rubripes TaxID=31033 RepID=A0A3B5K3M8_TAKRU